MTHHANLEEELESTDCKVYTYYEQVHAQRTHHFYISGEIEGAASYVDMIHKIRSATADEIVTIHLNTPGGDVSAGVQIINAMKFSEARIICSLEGEACSLGSMILLAADEFIIHDNTVVMIHNYTGGTYGKGHEQVSELTATIKWFSALAYTYYVPFISVEELENVLGGDDLWLQADEVRERLEQMVQIMQKELLAAEAAENKPPAKKRAVKKRRSKK